MATNSHLPLHLQLPRYSINQVALHNTKNNAWIVIHSTVIDATKFAKNHRGGRRILIKNAGIDITQLFNEKYKNKKKRDKAYQRIQPYIIGHMMHNTF